MRHRDVYDRQGDRNVFEIVSRLGDEPVTVKRAGEAFVDMPGKPHHFKNADSARPLRFLVAGTYHKGEALSQVLAQ